MKTVLCNLFNRFHYTFVSCFVLLSVQGAFCGQASTQGALCNPSASITLSTQLNIVMNDEACKELIKQIKALQCMLEETLTPELDNNKQLQKVKKSLTDSCFKLCSISELMKINAAKEPFIKVLVALCDASTDFIEDVLKPQELSPSNSSNIKALIKKIYNASNKIKNLLYSTGTNIAPNNTNLNNSPALEKCYSFVINDVNNILLLYPDITINNKKFKFNDIDKHVDPYTQRFAYHVKKAFAKYLTEKDLTALISFFESSAYMTLKNNSLTIITDLLKTFSPEIKAKTKTLLNQFWNQSQATIASAVEKIKEYIV